MVIADNQDDVYHLFVNDINFFDIEMNFEKSTKGSRTLYFLKSNMHWIPAFVVQFDKALSTMANSNNADVMSSTRDVVVF